MRIIIIMICITLFCHWMPIMNSHISAATFPACLLPLALLWTATGHTAEPTSVIEEIIVTGEKLERSLQDTPTSVKVVSAEQIETENLLDLEDVIERTANLAPNYAGTGFTIRGVSNTNVSGTGVGDLATVYVDGSPLPSEALLTTPLDLWDLAQVEVLRGPQSTLQGRNALAGAIVIRTRDPAYQWSARARVLGREEIGERRYSVAAGGPIITDQVAFRIAAESADSEGLIYNPTLGTEAAEGESDMVRAKLLIEPLAIPRLQIHAAYTHNERVAGERYSFVDGDDDWDDREILSNRPYEDAVESDIGVLSIDYDFSPALDLTSISTYNRVERTYIYDGDYTAVDESYGSRLNDQQTLSQEVRVTLDTERLRGIAGAYYSEVSNKDFNAYSVFGLAPDADLGLTNVLTGMGVPEPSAQFITSLYPQRVYIEALQENPQDIESYALFADFTWHLTDRVDLLGGFRYDHEKQDITTGQTVSIISELPNPTDYAALGPEVVGIIGLVNQFFEAEAQAANTPGADLDADFDAFLPKLGVSYHLGDEQTLSFIVQRGYRSGGSSINPAQASAYAFDPEYTWNYELSWRSRWLDDALTFNANAYYVDWTDQQVLVYLSDNTFDYETRNAGSSRLYGFEAELTYLVTPALEVYASIGHADTKFEEFVTGDAPDDDLSGNEFADAPRWTAAAGATWRHLSGFMANVNANHLSARYNLVTDQDAHDVPSRTLVNLKAGWEREHFGIYLTIDNLFDEEYTDRVFEPDAGTVSLLGEPRLLGLTLEASL